MFCTFIYVASAATCNKQINQQQEHL